MIPSARFQISAPHTVLYVGDASDSDGRLYWVEPCRFIPHPGIAHHPSANPSGGITNRDEIPSFHAEATKQ